MIDICSQESSNKIMTQSKSKYYYLIPSMLIVAGFLFIPTGYNYYITEDAEYGPWSDWSQCMKTCGESYQGRYRQCVKPPKGYGKTCTDLGSHMDTNPCILTPCPIDGGVGQWGAWEKCEQECKQGKRPRRRECNNPEPQYFGLFCEEPLVDYTPCISDIECPVDGKYGDWSAFTRCSKDCGFGKRTRKRKCIPPKYGGKPCDASGKPEEERPCNSFPCRIHGMYKNWSEWGSCSKTCDDGEQIRKRICIPPKNGGRPCAGAAEEKKKCNLKACKMSNNSTTTATTSAMTTAKPPKP